MAVKKKDGKKKSSKKKPKIVKNHRSEVSYKELSDKKSDEPSWREGKLSSELGNESDIEEEEDAEEKDFYGKPLEE